MLDQLDQNECIDNSTDMEAEAAQPSKALDTAVQAVIGSIGSQEQHKRNLALDDCLCRDRVDPTQIPPQTMQVQWM
jgi:hypothetical protein